MGQKVLLADDSITVQKIVKLSLTEEGIEVIAVGNGEQAIQQLESLQPDLVMADVFMPGKDGYEVCEFIKSHPGLRQIPVILLVHAFEPFDPDRAKKVGADHQLTKPFQSIRALVSTVQDLLQSPPIAASPAPVASTEPVNAIPAQVSAAHPGVLFSDAKRTDEEFAVVSSLPPSNLVNFAPEAAAQESMSGTITATQPVSFSPSSPLSEAGFPVLPTGMGEVSNADLLPPAELPVLPPTEWQAQTIPETIGWEAAAPSPSGDITSISSVMTPSSLTVAPVLGDAFADDVLELSDIAAANTYEAAATPVASGGNQLTPEAPLLAVFGNLSATPVEAQLDSPLQETSALPYTGSFDVGTGEMGQPSHRPSPTHNSRAQDYKVGTLSQTQGTGSLPLPEDVIEEIVNRVVQRLSTKAIQEIAWEVVPEMAELLLRKHISQQKHLTH